MTKITKNSMTVVWSRPVADGGSEVSGYILEKRDKKSLGWFKVLKETIRDTRQKVTGLMENSDYQYRVCAVNAAGHGPFSEPSDFYRAADPIGKCSIFASVFFCVWPNCTGLHNYCIMIGHCRSSRPSC